MDIRIPIGGTIVYLSPNFIDGGQVKKDEVLVITDPANFKDKVVLAKADLNIARDYSELVEDQKSAKIIISKIEDEYALAKELLLKITDTDELLSSTSHVSLSIHRRMP